MKLASPLSRTRCALEKKFGPGVSGGGMSVTALLSRDATMNDQRIGKTDSTMAMMSARYVSGLASHSAAEALRTLPLRVFGGSAGAFCGAATEVTVLISSSP